MSIGLETAKVITAAVRAAGKERGLKPLTVVVLDAGGRPVAAIAIEIFNLDDVPRFQPSLLLAARTFSRARGGQFGSCPPT